MKSIVKLPSFTVTVSLAVMVLTNTVALADSSAIQQAWLDDHVVVSVPVATNRVTTINFPGPIEAIDGAGFTVDGKTPGQFQLAHAQGSAFLSDETANRRRDIPAETRTELMDRAGRS